MASMNFSSPTGITRTGKLVRTRVELCSVDELIRIRNHLGEEQLKEFKGRYGDILDLLSIPVPIDTIKVLSHYWDNQFRCFVFPHCHLSLALEEYTSIMRMPIHEQTPVYSYPNRLPSRVQIAELIGLPQELMTFVKPGKMDMVPLKFLLEHMARLSRNKNWPLFNRVLALAVYGTVLFPSAEGAIDLAAISVFMAVEQQRVNPIPAILADTVMSLTYCLGRGGGKLRCCLQLLTVWIGNHIFGKGWSRGVRLERAHHPLRDFVEREGRAFQRISEGDAGATYKVWVAFFNGLASQDVKWKLVWWDSEEVLFSCGDFHNVPLVSARGGVNYNPSIALKQLAFEQKVPPSEFVQPLYFLHDDQSAEWNGRITQAWKHMNFKGRMELGVRQIHATAEFELWMYGPMGEGQPSVTPPPNPLMGRKDEKMKRAFDAEIGQQKDKIENLRAERKRQGKEIKKGEEEYALLHRDIRNLRRRGGWASTSQEKGHEIKQVEAELAASKKREQETRRGWEGERRKNNELRAEVRLEKRRAGEAQKEAKELAAHLKQEKEASDTLQKEIEDLTEAHIKRVEDLVWSRAEFQGESHELRERLGQIAQWVNRAVPNFSNMFYRAEDSMKPFYMTPQLQSFFDFSRALIEDWAELRRSPV